MVFGFQWAGTQKEQKIADLNTAQSGTISTPAPNQTTPPASALTTADLLPEFRALKSKTEAALRGDPNVDADWLDAKLKEMDSLWQSAAPLENTNPQQAMAVAWNALHGCLAMLLQPRLNDMLYVPPGEGQSGFFIDSKEVRVNAFNRFVQQEQWRPVNVASDVTWPIVHVTFYDAIAYADSHPLPRTIPTRDQYRRAFEYATSANIVLDPFGTLDDDSAVPFRVWGSMQEWTRTLDHDSDNDGNPWFGDTLGVVNVQLLNAGGYNVSYDAQHAFGRGHPRLGFRCVFRISSIPPGIARPGSRNLNRPELIPASPIV